MESEDRILKALDLYVEENYTYKDLPDMFHKKKLTAVWYLRSYQVWAAHEILEMLKSEWEGEPICVTIQDKLEDIRYMFDCFAMEPKPNTQMFVEAYEVATNLLDYAISVS